jgi:signal transduction histidine kinase/CheY-like chemotaxis protein
VLRLPLQPGGHNWRNVTPRVWLLVATVLVVSVLGVLTGLNALPFPRFWANLNYSIACVAACVMAAVGVREAPPADLSVRRLFAIGVGLYSLGQFVWDVQLVIGWTTEPAISDIAYLGSCLPFVLGLVAAGQRIEASRRTALTLDVCVVAVAVFAAVLALFGRPAFAGPQSNLAALVILAYPMAFLTVAGSCAVLAIASSAYPRPSVTFLAGLAATGIYWFIWVPTAVGTLPSSSLPINNVYIAGLLLLGFGTATWRTMPERSARQAGHAAVTIVPVVALIIAVASTYPWDGPHVDSLGLARLAGVLGLILVLARQTLLLRERERAQAALELAQERLASALDRLPGVAWTTDAALQVTSLRGGAVSQLGLDGVDRPEEALLALLAADDIDRLRDVERGALTGRSGTLEIRAHDRTLVVHVDPLTAGGPKPIGVVSIALDVTAERAAHDQMAQAARMESLGRLAGGIAHDFNNLLTAINGYAELALMEVGPDGAGRHEVEQIQEAGGRASQLTRQILAFARQTPTQIVPIDAGELVRSLQPLLSRLVSDDVVLKVDLGTAPLPVHADRAQAEQIVVNLVVNAREAMPRGGQVEITGRSVTDDTGEWVEIAVADSGTGMDETTLSRIFEPFFTTKSSGTGLGLATVYGAVRSAGGQIFVESTLGAGARFRVRLPRLQSEVAAPPARPAPQIADEPAGASILLVDDNDAVRTLARGVLRRAGYSVFEAANARAAIKYVRAGGRADSLVSDVVMPDMSGLELASLLLAEQPDLAVLLISGYPDAALDQHGLPAGARMLGKPFTPGQLLEGVEAVLRERRGG